MTPESRDPYINEEELQQAINKENARFPDRYTEAADEDDPLGGNVARSLPPSLPLERSGAFYREGIRLTAEERKAVKQIRTNQARFNAGLPPIDIELG